MTSSRRSQLYLSVPHASGVARAPRQTRRRAAHLCLLFPRGDGRTPGRSAVGGQAGALLCSVEEFKTLWHQRNDVRGVENQLKLFTHPELGILHCSRCTGIPRRETDRGCWCICRWMRRESGRWRGWRRRGNNFCEGLSGNKSRLC